MGLDDVDEDVVVYRKPRPLPLCMIGAFVH